VLNAHVRIFAGGGVAVASYLFITAIVKDFLKKIRKFTTQLMAALCVGYTHNYGGYFVITRKKESLDKWKVCVEIVAIVLSGFFVVWKWGVESYWSREDNYRASFKNISQIEKSPLYLKVGSDPNGDYLTVSGEVIVSNLSISPIQIEKTFLYFIPFSLDECDLLSTNIKFPESDDCIKSINTSSIFKKECKLKTDNCNGGFKTEIHPIDDLPLFGRSDANRPFDVRLPRKYFNFKEEKQGLFVIAEQEVGEACLQESIVQIVWDSMLFRKCKKSRALSVVVKLPW